MDSFTLAAAVGGVMLLGIGAMGRNPLLLAVTGDEDMKIAPAKGLGGPPEDAAELAARQYLDMKRCGSIDKARRLGERLMEILVEESGDLPGTPEEDSLIRHQRIVLFSYAINRVLSERSPNSILAQTSLNVFYDAVEEREPVLYRHISDMAAFSLYILCDRDRGRTDCEIGMVYARLCGSPDDPGVIGEGNELYHAFYEHCAREQDNLLP